MAMKNSESYYHFGRSKKARVKKRNSLEEQCKILIMYYY